jgi:hypothetical protein
MWFRPLARRDPGRNTAWWTIAVRRGGTSNSNQNLYGRESDRTGSQAGLGKLPATEPRLCSSLMVSWLTRGHDASERKPRAYLTDPAVRSRTDDIGIAGRGDGALSLAAAVTDLYRLGVAAPGRGLSCRRPPACRASRQIDAVDLMTKAEPSLSLTWRTRLTLHGEGDPVDSEAQHIGSGSDRCLIPDLRGITLAQLARQAATGEKDVTGVVSRIVDSRESPSGVPAMMFNSTI